MNVGKPLPLVQSHEAWRRIHTPEDCPGVLMNVGEFFLKSGVARSIRRFHTGEEALMSALKMWLFGFFGRKSTLSITGSSHLGKDIRVQCMWEEP